MHGGSRGAAGWSTVARAIALSSFAVEAQAQSPVPPYVSQFGLDAQHTGRSAFVGPHASPHIAWRVRALHRVYASPVLSIQRLVVFAGIDGGVHAVDAEGIERWAHLGDHPVFASPAAFGDYIVVGSDGGAVTSLDTRGAVHWTHPAPEDVDASPTLTRDGAMYVVSRGLEALDPDGRHRWTTALAAHAYAAPALSHDEATVVVATVAGELVWMRASDGNVERRVQIGATLYGAPLVLDDDTVVVGARDGHVRAYGRDGAQRWDFATHDEVHASAALTRDGIVVIGSDDGGIYGLHARDGTQAWRVTTSGRVRSSARIDADGFIFVGSEDDLLYALEPSGNVAWTINLGADVDSSPLITPWGAIAVGCDDASMDEVIGGAVTVSPR